MKTRIIFAFLAITLAACAPATTPASTKTPSLSATSSVIPSTFTLTAEATSITVTPSPMPTQPIILMITPDSIQVERWKEYENVLAMNLLGFLPRDQVLCEWEILGQSVQEVYVWAICGSTIYTAYVENIDYFSTAEMPAVIHLGADGVIQSMKTPGSGTSYARDIREMFPKDIQEKIFGNLTNYRQLSEYLKWRREHPGEPPLIILSATPTP